MIGISPRPFFVQKRFGKNHEPFTYFKIKTMKDSHPGSGRAYMEEQRIPLLGRLLRRFHIDELTELLLICIGKESFVGPRPLMEEHEALVASVERRSVRPGWTGYAQLYLRKKGVLPSRVQRRLDRKQVLEMSPRLYWKILLATGRSLCWKKGTDSAPGKTVETYRQNLLKKEKELDET